MELSLRTTCPMTMISFLGRISFLWIVTDWFFVSLIALCRSFSLFLYSFRICEVLGFDLVIFGIMIVLPDNSIFLWTGRFLVDSTKPIFGRIDVFGIKTACCCFFFNSAACADSSRGVCVLIVADGNWRESIN